MLYNWGFFIKSYHRELHDTLDRFRLSFMSRKTEQSLKTVAALSQWLHLVLTLLPLAWFGIQGTARNTEGNHWCGIVHFAVAWQVLGSQHRHYIDYSEKSFPLAARIRASGHSGILCIAWTLMHSKFLSYHFAHMPAGILACSTTISCVTLHQHYLLYHAAQVQYHYRSCNYKLNIP